MAKRAVLYRVLDGSTLGAFEPAALTQAMESVLESDSDQVTVARDWVVGRFDNDATRRACIDTLARAGARWIDVAQSAERCTFGESGRFLPDPRLLRLLAVHADAEWLMPWPWYCALPAQAARDLLTDLTGASSSDVHLALLRRHQGEALGSQEPDFRYAGATLPVLPRRLVGEALDPAVDLDTCAARRAGWGLETNSLARLRAPSQTSKRRPTFHIGICLRARACSRDWSVTCRNLERTLENLSRQRSKAFRVWIAVHERPEIRTFGLDLDYVVVDFAPPVREDGTFGNDKRRKRNAIGEALRGAVEGSFYYLQLDADDLVDPSLVQAALEDDNRRGYLIESGYIYDMQQRAVARCDEKTVPFWHQCGSSAVLYFEPEELLSGGDDDESYFSRQRRHEMFATVAQERGRPLALWADDMALYLVNHGENDWSTYRYEAAGRANSKSNFVHRHQLVAPAEIEVLALRYPELDSQTATADELNREVTTS